MKLLRNLTASLSPARAARARSRALGSTLARLSLAASLIMLPASGASAQLLGGTPAAPGAPAALAGSVQTQLQSPLPPPPAGAIAARYASIGDYANAIKKLSEITASATYKNTPYAAEAFYSIAHIQEDHLHDNNSAITALNSLVNNFSRAAFTYPDASKVVAERNALGQRIDKENHAAALAGPKSWGDLPSIFAALLATGYVVVDFFVKLTGAQNFSYWLALLMISVIIRLLLYPLSIKQYKSMKEMQRVQPMMKELQAKYKNDRATLQAKQMELYREHQINPAAGCLPMLAQLPIFYYMYHAVWLYQYKFSHGTFLWVTPAAHHLFPTFLGANLADQDIVLLALYAASMYITQRMMPVSDPQQAEMQKSTAMISAVMFFILFQNYHFESAFVLYWLFSNIVSTVVQLFVMRQHNLTTAALNAGGASVASTAVVQGQLLDGASTGSNVIVSGNGSNGARKALANGTGGAAQGMIAPRIHPKKKRR